MEPTTHDFFKDTEDRNDFYIALPVIALALLFVLWQWNKSDKTISDEVESEQVVEMASMGNTVSSYETQRTELEVTQEKVEEKVESAKANTAKSTPIEKNIPKQKVETPKSTEESTSVTESKIIEIVEESAELETPKKKEEINYDNEQETPESQATEIITEPITKTTPVEVIRQDCSIAVGLYKDPTNLDKMYNRLIEDGYAAQITSLRNSKKVSIDITCNQAASQQILKKIRASYAKDAFIE